MPLTKTIFRTNCIEKIKYASKHNKLYNDAKINIKLQRELKRLKHKNILFYYPLHFEADIRKSISKLRRKCNLFVPFMQSASFKMVPFRLPLNRSKFGIYEAGNSLRNIRRGWYMGVIEALRVLVLGIVTLVFLVPIMLNTLIPNLSVTVSGQPWGNVILLR